MVPYVGVTTLRTFLLFIGGFIMAFILDPVYLLVVVFAPVEAYLTVVVWSRIVELKHDMKIDLFEV